MVEYDVLGNERHKAICKLREMPKLYPGKDGSADVFAWKRELANAIGADTELFSAIRNRLIHLLGGDQPTLSDLFGIWKGDDDGVDARPSDSASDDSPDHGSCACGGRCGAGVLDDGVAPITTELRDRAERYCNFKDDNIVKFREEEFDCLCDNIDAIHAGLEHDVEMWRDRAEDMRMERDEYLDSVHLWEFKCGSMVELPRDADGVPIHIGDVMDFTKNVRGLTVLGIGIVDANERSLGVFVRDGNDYVWYNAEFLHHHTQTVEDVLRQVIACANNGQHVHGALATEDIIAEYAAKLKLADA